VLALGTASSFACLLIWYERKILFKNIIRWLENYGLQGKQQEKRKIVQPRQAQIQEKAC
jgi:hypothetical protein